MDATPCARVNILARPYSSGEIKYVINGTVTNPKKAPTMGPNENAPLFYDDITHELPLPIFYQYIFLHRSFKAFRINSIFFSILACDTSETIKLPSLSLLD